MINLRGLETYQISKCTHSIQKQTRVVLSVYFREKMSFYSVQNKKCARKKSKTRNKDTQAPPLEL